MLLKKYSDFGGGKQNNLIQFLSYNLRLNTGKNFAVCATKIINILTLVLSEKTFLNEKCKLNGRPLTRYKLMNYTQKTSS
jgi:hypothetical protein